LTDYSFLSNEAEVADLDGAQVASKQEVLEFEVTVGDAEVVHVGDGRRDLDRPGARSILAQRTCRLHVVQRVAALRVLQHLTHTQYTSYRISALMFTPHTVRTELNWSSFANWSSV